MRKLSQRQKQIVEMAIDLISEKGIQQFTIKNLALRVGVTDGAIYRHFDSKEEILLTILLTFQEESAQVLNRICTSTHSAVKDIENIFIHHLTYFTKKPAVSAVIFSEDIFQNSATLSQEVYKLLSMHEDSLVCILKKGKEQNEFKSEIGTKELVRIIIGSIRYTVKKWRLSNYKFDLIEEGKTLLESIKILLKP